MNRIFIVALLTIVVSCSPQRILQKSFVGKPQSVLAKEFGKPKNILTNEQEKVFIYEKIKELQSAEIKQGKLTLDPMVSPMVKKTERYYFTVKNEIITKVKLEEEYER